MTWHATSMSVAAACRARGLGGGAVFVRERRRAGPWSCRGRELGVSAWAAHCEYDAVDAALAEYDQRHDGSVQAAAARAGSGG